MRTRSSRVPMARIAAILVAAVVIPGCATMMEGYGPAAEETVPRDLQYYDEQIRVLRERINALERELEVLRRRVEDGAKVSTAAEGARMQRIEARLDEVERGRRADRAVIVDEVVAEIEALLRQSAPSSRPSGSAGGGAYVVQPGDTLWGIARRFGTTVAAIQQANGLTEASVIREGRTLTIP